MLDIGWTEIAIIVVVAIIVIGPKDLPRVLRTVGEWVGKAKSLSREFRSHVDDMIRETELDEVKRQIENAGNTDIKGYVENTIDPDGDIRDAMNFDGIEGQDTGDAESDEAGESDKSADKEVATSAVTPDSAKNAKEAG